MPPIVVTEHGPPVSAAHKFLSSLPTYTSEPVETQLLKAIKAVLRGTDADCSTSIKSARFFTGDESKDHELSWNATNAVLSYGGVILKRWCFDHEGEAIQWACLGEIEQTVVPNARSCHSAANYAMAENTPPSSSSPSTSTQHSRPTFGPFHRANVEQAKKDEYEAYTQVVPCAFIFLRSIGKMYLLNGLDYTFSLPFIVRKAWPVSPHGVMMQRVLEKSEVQEAEESGEEVLPTVFTLTSPFEEAAAVGHTEGILRPVMGLDKRKEAQAVLKDEDEHLKNPLRSIPPTEMVVWVSHVSVIADARVVVTVDVRKRLLSVWQYVYIKPKGLAYEQNSNSNSTEQVHMQTNISRVKGKHRQSISSIPPGSRRTSALFDAERQRPFPTSPGRTVPDPSSIPAEFFDLPDTLPLASLPGMKPSLTSTMTMASIGSSAGVVSGSGGSQKKTTQSQQQVPQTVRGRRNSLGRNEGTLERLDWMGRGGAGGGGARLAYEDAPYAFSRVDHGRMKAAYWMECLFTQEIPEEDALSWTSISASLFDNRFDGKRHRCLLSVSLPTSKVARIYELAMVPADTNASLGVNQPTQMRMEATFVKELNASASASLRVSRENAWDLVVLSPEGRLGVLTNGLRELDVDVRHPPEKEGEVTVLVQEEDLMDVDVDASTPRHKPSTDSHHPHGRITSLSTSDLDGTVWSTITLAYEDGYEGKLTFDCVPRDRLVREAFELCALTMPGDVMFELRVGFLERWLGDGWVGGSGRSKTEWECFKEAIVKAFSLGREADDNPGGVGSDPGSWEGLKASKSDFKFADDPVLRDFQRPPAMPHLVGPVKTKILPPHPLLAPLLYALHTMAEHLRLSIPRQQDLVRFVEVVCRVAMRVRPEWADYWKRLVPWAVRVWDDGVVCPPEYIDDRLPVWPPDLSAILYGRVSTPDWKVPWHDVHHIVSRFGIEPSLEYGVVDPLRGMHRLSMLYNTLSDGKVAETQKRAEHVVLEMVVEGLGGDRGGEGMGDVVRCLPLGVKAPLMEAVRTCQLAPPGNWPLEAYQAIGRNDLAKSSGRVSEGGSGGYKTRKEFINPQKRREEISEITMEARSLAGEVESLMSGVDLGLKEFTDIRFGLDRRLEEVARMLCSSAIPTIKGLDRETTNEHDQAKEYQSHALRVAERTFALPYGRAMFTFGSVPVVNREAFSIPKIEYSFRIVPPNIVLTPEPGKISPESIAWGEFHNGVAAALRIGANAAGVESSWIAFNKPGELSPEHAGFLLGLGLTGHLKALMTWHTFSYLTPKHDLTSIGMLLGMAAANVGTGNQHITKLLAVHTPALLPTQDVDLNISLITQAAGVAGIGLLYLGTKNRRMAEVCLSQISRRDLVQPDLSNEHREAYTYASALAFGMIMLGKGTMIPVDLDVVKRLSALIHGSASSAFGREIKSFDINLTSPAASIALGLMYLRTGRQDVADILTIPDTVVELHAIQPMFLLIRTIARSLILWDSIKPDHDWIASQIPATIREALASRQKTGNQIDDAMDLAYYNIVPACCFAIGLKFAGTARQEAYQLIVHQFDLFSRMAYATGPAFDHKIKRSAVRDGLNLIAISLSMVMAGTGEITCLRRLRYAYGMSQQTMYLHGFKYGVHVSMHLALGLLFLGGGRHTLGTSDAAIAAMVMAFFPRFHHVSSDNRSYLQALRHMWVLAVEPRCLIARDVDTNEVVYLPIKITMQEDIPERTQLISPTLIPDIDRLMSIRVDTPRYWPFYLDTAAHPRHKEALLMSQTLYVKRRTAFLSYTEDPRGSRSLFVRSGSSAGDAATLDFPQLTDTRTHPAGDLGEFITSFSNNILFLSFADHFSRPDGLNDDEIIFQTYCHASLLDSILQDKPQTLQSHLTLYMYRNMSPQSRYFHLRLQDLRFAADFYAKVYDRRFSGRAENNPRPPLIRDTTVQGALHALDRKLDTIRTLPAFKQHLARYTTGEALTKMIDPQLGELSPLLAWYLLRNGVPVSTVLFVLRQLARDAHIQCLGIPPPEGTPNAQALDQGIKEVLHATGTRMTTSLGSGWSVRSLDEIIASWNIS